jgi:protein SCO1/2
MGMGARRLLAGLVGLSTVLALTSCQSEKPLPEQRFDLRGKVLGIDRNAGTVRLQHEAIPNYMAAMTMDYPVKDKWVFDVLKPGQTVRATLVVATDRAWLEGIVVTEEAKAQSGLTVDADSAGTSIGKEVPDFPLVNQDGKRVHLHQYRGKALLLTFIYTRCPMPNYCPLMSKNFAQILERTQGDPKLSASTHLLSISIDPEYDKPAVLRAYGSACAGNPHPFERWEFASGTPDQVRKIAEFFGLKYWTDSGQIVHALVTALVGPDGKVIKVYRGNDWLPAEVLADIRALPRG